MTIPADEATRVRSYVSAQAAKLSLPDLVAKVRADSLALCAAGDAGPSERFSVPPAAGEWSAAQVWAHVLATTEQFSDAIEHILDHGALPPAGLDVTARGEQLRMATAGQFWAAFEARRERLYARVLQASGDEHLDLTIVHPMFGPFNWREWLLFLRVHDLDHLRQLRAIGQAFAG